MSAHCPICASSTTRSTQQSLPRSLRTTRDAPPDMISFSDGIRDGVASLGISYEQVLESIEILVSQRLVNARKFLGPRYQLDGIPDYVWLAEEARSGLDIDSLRRQMLS